MYKIVACDLDETLLSQDKSISEENIKAIKLARQKGVKFVPTSGRGFIDIVGVLKTIGVYDAKNEYVISYNGGAVTENKNSSLLFYQGITFEQASYLYKYGLELDVCIHVHTKDKIYAYNISEEEFAYAKGRSVLTEIFDKDIEFLKGQEIVKCLYMNTNKEYLKSVADSLKDFTKNMSVTFSSNRYMEFGHYGIDKGIGLACLANILRVDMKDTIAIGDNINDIPMLEAAGLGVAVQNSLDEVKRCSDVVTKESCDESAVARVLYDYVL